MRGSSHIRSDQIRSYIVASACVILPVRPGLWTVRGDGLSVGLEDMRFVGGCWGCLCIGVYTLVDVLGSM